MRKTKLEEAIERQERIRFEIRNDFRILYPEIADINGTVQEVGHVATDKDPINFSMNAREYYECSNPSCLGGHFSISEHIRGMVDRREIHGEFKKMCRGGEPPRACWNMFKLTVDIKYKD